VSLTWIEAMQSTGGEKQSCMNIVTDGVDRRPQHVVTTEVSWHMAAGCSCVSQLHCACS